MVFIIEAENERVTAAGSRCRENLKYENLASSFSSLHQKIATKSVSHVQHDYFCSFNQSCQCFVASSLHVQHDFSSFNQSYY